MRRGTTLMLTAAAMVLWVVLAGSPASAGLTGGHQITQTVTAPGFSFDSCQDAEQMALDTISQRYYIISYRASACTTDDGPLGTTYNVTVTAQCVPKFFHR